MIELYKLSSLDSDCDSLGYNTTIHFTCNECYYLTGEVSLTCLPSGSWNYEAPVCTRKSSDLSSISNTKSCVYICGHAVIRCAVLEAPVNGSMDSLNTTCQTVVQFQCEETYELIGSSSLTCMPNR